jgi:isopentenyl diphosphate isomerase/L-lactate dehydrogenase-like FMN-dependent dehydrogenase
VAKAVALGAALGGMALPFIRAVSAGGVEEVLALIERLGKTIRSVMLLAGCPDVAALQSAPVMRAPWFRDAVSQLKQAEGLEP